MTFLDSLVDVLHGVAWVAAMTGGICLILSPFIIMGRRETPVLGILLYFVFLIIMLILGSAAINWWLHTQGGASA